MTIIEICCGTAPEARAAAFLGLNSISFDNRGDQITTASSLLVEFFAKYKYKPVSIIFLIIIKLYCINYSRIMNPTFDLSSQKLLILIHTLKKRK
jgi:hypothetical protein